MVDMLWRTLGHGDAFVFRDPAGIRPAYYQDDEIVVVPRRPVIQTVFNVPFEEVHEIDQESIIKKTVRCQ
jgi:amidophosphoribosyltransferase